MRHARVRCAAHLGEEKIVEGEKKNADLGVGGDETIKELR